MLTFEEHIQFRTVEKLFESINSTILDVESKLHDLHADERSDEEQAKLLLALLNADGNIDKLDESESDAINEGFIVHLITEIGAIMGNAALIESICHYIHKKFNVSVDSSKAVQFMSNFSKTIAHYTGAPAKAVEMFLMFIAKKLKLTGKNQEIVSLLGMGALVVILLCLGIIGFPALGQSLLYWLLSLTGIIGKSVEIIKIAIKVFNLLIDKIGDSFNDIANADDLADLLTNKI